MNNPLDVSVVIVSFNTRDLLRHCLTAVGRELEGLRAEVLVVDNASRDASADMVEQEFPAARLFRSSLNLGFGAANNLAFAIALGRYVVLLNSDAFIKEGGLRRAVEKMDAAPEVGMAGAKLVGRDGELQPSARLFPSLLNEFLVLSGLAARHPDSRLLGRFDRTWADPDQPAQVDWVPGAFAILRREVLEQAGYFDERFFLYYEEVDLCRRIRAAGHQIAYWPELEVIHYGGESSKTMAQLALSSSGKQLTLWRMRSCLLYYRKHHGLLAAWLVASLEKGWHWLRAVKNQVGAHPEKAVESRTVAGLMAQAWRETGGGLVSPQRPW